MASNQFAELELCEGIPFLLALRPGISDLRGMLKAAAFPKLLLPGASARNIRGSAMLRLLFAGALVAGPFQFLAAGTPPGRLWDVRRLEANRTSLQDVASDRAGRMVAVGDGGVIRFAHNYGASWSLRDSGSRADLLGVAWNGSRWVAVGGNPYGNGVILTSSDGSNWTHCCIGETERFNAVAASPSVTVAASNGNGKVVWSKDSVTWNVSQDGSNDYLTDVIWTGTRFITLSWSGSLASSSDGVEWTEEHPRNPASQERFLSLAGNGSVLVAVGLDYGSIHHLPVMRVHTASGDWVKVWFPPLPGATRFTAVEWGVEWDGQQLIECFVAMADNGMVLTSADGLNWSEQDKHTRPEAGTGVSGVLWDGHRLAAVGDNGMILLSETLVPDSTGDWMVKSAPDPCSGLNGVAEGAVGVGRRVVMVGDSGTVVTSDDDCASFIERGPVAAHNLNAVTATSLAAKRFLAVGDGGTILSSPDGVVWTSETSNTTSPLKGIVWFSPVSGSPFAIAVGHDGTVVVSDSTASTWTRSNIGTGNEFPLNDVAATIVTYNAPLPLSRAVAAAVGSGGKIVTSFDGVTWTERDSGTTRDLYAVTDWEHGFVAVGWGISRLTSSDGTFWTEQPIDPAGGYGLEDVAWTGSQLIAADKAGFLLASSDADVWARRHTPLTTPMRSVAALASGRLVACGPGGVVMTSDSSGSFGDWMAAQNPPPGQAGPDADPNGDGVPNILAYALGIPAVAAPSPGDLSALPRMVAGTSGESMSMQLRANPERLADLVDIIEVSTTLEPGSWVEVLRHEPGEECPSGTLDVYSQNMFGEGVNFTGPLRIGLPPASCSFGASKRCFARLRVELR
jgi:hypothetical protein